MAVSVAKSTIILRCPVTLWDRKTPCAEIAVPDGGLPRETALFDRGAAETAVALSLSAADDKLLADNLNRLGCGDIHTVKSDGSPDKIGMSLACRSRGDTLEVCVVLNGTQGSEWLTNFDIGYAAEHSGFARAADFAEQQTDSYVFTRAIGTQPRFLVTGYSRGGAVANILAKRLCERRGTDSVCAYTLASPALTISRRRAKCHCIFNLVRGEDFFARVPPEHWGYTRYGRDILLPSGDIRARYRALTGEEYIGFTHPSEADDILAAVTRLAPNVPAYYKRRRKVDGRPLSLYEVMTSVARILAGEAGEEADLLLTAMVSEYADLLDHLSAGSDIARLLTSAEGIPRCSIADSHSPAAYLAAMEDLFTTDRR